jgi:radical SAM superfamily enzyme YgiQ (UPF0313 family)
MSVDVMPLGIGFMKAVMDRELPAVESSLFAYPDQLWDAVRTSPPDVLMLSNYCWNEALSCHLAEATKRLSPDTLVVMGGPNLPLEVQQQVAFVLAHPALDLYILGEGDVLATEVVRRFVEVDGDLDALREADLPSCLQRRRDGQIVLTESWSRHKAVDEVPSPWTSGIMDRFFDGKLAPMIETNRGCPFKCTFCVQGTDWYTKVHYFSTERIKADIDYIGRRIRERSPSMGTLFIADPNFGMYERDAEIAGFIGEAQARHGWPTFISASTGKNRPDRIMNALVNVNDALTFRQALQSTNANTLVEIKRSNIKQDAYASVMRQVSGRGMRSISDLILGLPHETLASHVGAINQLVDLGTKEMYNFQLMMLKGTELATLEQRTAYGFETRYRVLSKGFGVYAGEKVFDTEEIVVRTSSMSFDDYVAARTYAFAFSVFWNNSWFEDLVAIAGAHGIRPSEVLGAMRRQLGEDDGPAGRMLADFVAATKGELFSSREACVAFYADAANFERLADGEIGDNLLYRYRAAASFFQWPAVCEAACTAVARLFRERGIEVDDELWSDVGQFVMHSHAHGTTPAEILEPVDAELRHDVGAWLKAGVAADPRRYRIGFGTFRFELPSDSAEELRALLRVWGTDLKALTRGVGRVRSTAQRRTCIRTDASAYGQPA